MVRKQKPGYASAIICLAGTMLFGPSKANAWSLFNSDASRYRDECYEKCVEDSFGRAGAREINQRCSNKCDSLPESPRVEWARYDRCITNGKSLIENLRLCLPSAQSSGQGSRSSKSRDCVFAEVDAEYSYGWKPGMPLEGLVERKCVPPSSNRPKK